MTDRYTKAIEQLGSDKLDVRIGGIYALERVARDSARDHPTVMEVLTAFIREHSREQWPPSDPRRPEPHRYRPDVQAAVTVVGRRDARRDIRQIDLAGANLGLANLAGANLTGANLFLAHLDAAYLIGADLGLANLAGASLAEAVLTGATLAGAKLTSADLTRADLTRANLARTDLTRLDLTRATLTGADLTGARWPEGAPVPEGWTRDTGSGRLIAADADAETTEAN